MFEVFEKEIFLDYVDLKIATPDSNLFIQKKKTIFMLYALSYAE